MQITVEMSLYPLVEDYTRVIIDFIRGLNDNPDVLVRTTAMSTYISGEYEVVMNLLTNDLKPVFEQIPDSATVLKIIPKDLNVEDGFLNF